MGFARLLILFIIGYFIYRFINRILFPFQNSANPQEKRKEGDVTIDFIEKKKSKKNDENGDYIEYEEV